MLLCRPFYRLIAVTAFFTGLLPSLLRCQVWPPHEVRLQGMDGRQGHPGREGRQIMLPKMRRKGTRASFTIRILADFHV